ncbi:MAG: hypothetical protein NT007_14365 [Candidatus Kapabacteria bacterium]|nr:hypothetical protein [Candidatus Kapabacteria bacterium]
MFRNILSMCVVLILFFVFWQNTFSVSTFSIVDLNQPQHPQQVYDYGSNGAGYRLTEASGTQSQAVAVAIWCNTQINLASDNFCLTFEARFSETNKTGIGSGYGGDGLAFVLQNSSSGTNAIGASGGAIGYSCDPSNSISGISNSLAVEFDTFHDNGTIIWDDGLTSDDHVSFILNGNNFLESNFVGQKTPKSLAPNNNGIIRDGIFHPIKIKWVHTYGTFGILSIYCEKSLIRSETIDFSKFYLNSSNANFWWGFTASNGVEIDYKYIKSINFTTDINSCCDADVFLSKINGDDLSRNSPYSGNWDFYKFRGDYKVCAGSNVEITVKTEVGVQSMSYSVNSGTFTTVTNHNAYDYYINETIDQSKIFTINIYYEGNCVTQKTVTIESVNLTITSPDYYICNEGMFDFSPPQLPPVLLNGVTHVSNEQPNIFRWVEVGKSNTSYNILNPSINFTGVSLPKHYTLYADYKTVFGNGIELYCHPFKTITFYSQYSTSFTVIKDVCKEDCDGILGVYLIDNSNSSTVTMPSSYYWTLSNGSTTTTSSNTVSIPDPGLIKVDFDYNNCHISSSFTMPTKFFNVGINQTGLSQYTATITNAMECNPPYDYVWKNSGGVTIGTSQTINLTMSGTYYVYSTNSTNCVVSRELIIPYTEPVLTLSFNSNTFCNEYDITPTSATVAGGLYPYTFILNGNTYPPTKSMVVNFTINTTGSHTLTVKDGMGKTATKVSNFSIGKPFVVQASGGLVCKYNTTATFTTIPNNTSVYDYQWYYLDYRNNTPKATTSEMTEPNSPITQIHASGFGNIYFVKVTDKSTGCSNSSNTIRVNYDDNSISAPDFAVCSGELINIFGLASNTSRNDLIWHWEPSNLCLNPNEQYTDVKCLYSTTFTLSCSSTISGCTWVTPVKVTVIESSKDFANLYRVQINEQKWQGILRLDPKNDCQYVIYGKSIANEGYLANFHQIDKNGDITNYDWGLPYYELFVDPTNNCLRNTLISDLDNLCLEKIYRKNANTQKDSLAYLLFTATTWQQDNDPSIGWYRSFQFFNYFPSVSPRPTNWPFQLYPGNNGFYDTFFITNSGLTEDDKHLELFHTTKLLQLDENYAAVLISYQNQTGNVSPAIVKFPLAWSYYCPNGDWRNCVSTIRINDNSDNYDLYPTDFIETKENNFIVIGKMTPKYSSNNFYYPFAVSFDQSGNLRYFQKYEEAHYFANCIKKYRGSKYVIFQEGLESDNRISSYFIIDDNNLGRSITDKHFLKQDQTQSFNPIGFVNPWLRVGASFEFEDVNNTGQTRFPAFSFFDGNIVKTDGLNNPSSSFTLLRDLIETLPVSMTGATNAFEVYGEDYLRNFIGVNSKKISYNFNSCFPGITYNPDLVQVSNTSETITISTNNFNTCSARYYHPENTYIYNPPLSSNTFCSQPQSTCSCDDSKIKIDILQSDSKKNGNGDNTCCFTFVFSNVSQNSCFVNSVNWDDQNGNSQSFSLNSFSYGSSTTFSNWCIPEFSGARDVIFEFKDNYGNIVCYAEKGIVCGCSCDDLEKVKNNFEIRMEPVDNNSSDDCCYYLVIDNKNTMSLCAFRNDIKLNYTDNITDLSFSNIASNWSSGTISQSAMTFSSDYQIKAGTSKTLTEVCVPQSINQQKIYVSLSGCSKSWTFDASCPKMNTICCSDLSTTISPNGTSDGTVCCYQLKFSIGNSNDCGGVGAILITDDAGKYLSYQSGTFKHGINYSKFCVSQGDFNSQPSLNVNFIFINKNGTQCLTKGTIYPCNWASNECSPDQQNVPWLSGYTGTVTFECGGNMCNATYTFSIRQTLGQTGKNEIEVTDWDVSSNCNCPKEMIKKMISDILNNGQIIQQFNIGAGVPTSSTFCVENFRLVTADCFVMSSLAGRNRYTICSSTFCCYEDFVACYSKDENNIVLLISGYQSNTFYIPQTCPNTGNFLLPCVPGNCMNWLFDNPIDNSRLTSMTFGKLNEYQKLDTLNSIEPDCLILSNTDYVKNKMSIVINCEEKGELLIEFYDLLGNKIEEFDIEKSNKYFTTDINYNLRSGVYICKISLNNRVFAYKEFLVTK